MIILLSILVFLTFLNLILLFNIGLFLVRFKERANLMFTDILEAMSVVYGAIPEQLEQPEPTKTKTWDEKYEEELEMIARRVRENSGLKDLSDTGPSWGVPPAPNAANSDGLIIKDV